MPEWLATMLIDTAPLFFGTRLHRNIDRRGLEKLAASMARRFDPGSPAALEAYLDAFDPAEKTRPPETVSIEREPLENPLIDLRGLPGLTSERISFTGMVPVPEGHPAATARFHHYRHTGTPASAPEKGPTVVFLPGLGVSESAFSFIGRLMLDILRSGRDLLLYIPPFHLERSAGTAGEELHLFDADLTLTLDFFFGMVREIRTAMTSLQSSAGPDPAFGGWGGSMGAALLLELARHEEIASAALMIPVVDWATIITGEICGAVCLPQLEAAGFGRELVERALKVMSPYGYGLPIDPERIMIQAAELDQLTPPQRIRKFAEAQDIENLRYYRKGHASILLDRTIYRDYRAFLTLLPDNS